MYTYKYSSWTRLTCTNNSPATFKFTMFSPTIQEVCCISGSIVSFCCSKGRVGYPCEIYTNIYNHIYELYHGWFWSNMGFYLGNNNQGILPIRVSKISLCRTFRFGDGAISKKTPNFRESNKPFPRSWRWFNHQTAFFLSFFWTQTLADLHEALFTI